MAPARPTLAHWPHGTLERIVYLGSGALAGLARESALKVLELTAGQVVGFSDSALGFRHGPKAVLDERHARGRVPLQRPLHAPVRPGHSRGAAAALAAEDLVTILGGMPNCRLAGKPGSCPASKVSTTRCWPYPQCSVPSSSASSSHSPWDRTPDNPFPSGDVNRVVQGVTLHALHS